MEDLDELLSALQNSKSFYPTNKNGLNTKKMSNITKQDIRDPDYDYPDDTDENPSKQNNNETPLRKNLNELDNLLKDLSSPQFVAQISQTSKPPLNNKNNGHTNDDLKSKYKRESYGAASSGNSSGTALSATQELDSLLESLSDFKIKQKPTENNSCNTVKVEEHVVEDPLYSIPKKWKDRQLKALSSCDPLPKMQPGNDQNQLDNMLGNLQKDLSKQGVNMIEKGVCAACSNPIIGQVITALGYMWHPEHFVCNHCKTSLGTNTFFERDGKPFCEEDYHLLFSPQCAACNDPILDHCLTALDRTWHPNCFCCTTCKRPFGKEGFHEKDGKPFCREDYFEMFAPKCFACQTVIQDNFISALNKHWHTDCFVCKQCRSPFGKGSFYEQDGYPYCEKDFYVSRGSVCADCSEPITGRCITAMGQKYHPEHFRCKYCCQALNKGTFKEKDNKPFCHSCYVRLYCTR